MLATAGGTDVEDGVDSGPETVPDTGTSLAALASMGVGPVPLATPEPVAVVVL